MNYKWNIPNFNEKVYELLDKTWEGVSEIPDKKCIIVNKENPFHIIGIISPTIYTHNGSYYYSGKYKLFCNEFDLSKTRIVNSIHFFFHTVVQATVELGGKKEAHLLIGKNVLDSYYSKFSYLEDRKDKLIELEKLTSHFRGGIIPDKIKEKSTKLHVLPFHQFLNKEMSIYCYPEPMLNRVH